MTSLKSTVLFESCADAFWNSNHTGLGGGGEKSGRLHSLVQSRMRNNTSTAEQETRLWVAMLLIC